MKRKVLLASLLGATAMLLGACGDDATSGASVKIPCTDEGTTLCGADGNRMVCTDGVYVADPCDNGETCRNGQCLTACSVSEFTAECDSVGKRVFCDNGAVRTEACETGEYCENGTCRKPQQGKTCDAANYVKTCDGNAYTTCENGQVVKHSCETGKICDAGECKTQNPEPTACDEGKFSPRCGGTQSIVQCRNGVESAEKCLGNEICVDGNCQTSCENAYQGCSEDGVSRLFCENGVIKNEKCPSGIFCQSGTCTSGNNEGDPCDKGTFNPTCDAQGNRLVCGDDGLVKKEKCLTGKCSYGVCDADAPCSSSMTPYCTADGQKIVECVDGKETALPCMNGKICEGGYCQIITPNSCKGDEKKCIDREIVSVCRDGAWHSGYCNKASEICLNGVCADKSTLETCDETAYEARCDEKQAYACIDGYVAKMTCNANQHCENGRCLDNIKAGDDCAEDTFIQQCLDDGTLAYCKDGKIASGSCYDKVCKDGACVECGDGDPMRCVDATHVTVCADKKMTPKACADNQHCEKGACVDNPKEGEDCDETLILATCMEDGKLLKCTPKDGGHKIQIADCPEDTPVCLGDKCVQCNPDGFGTQCKDGKELTCTPDGSLTIKLCPEDGNLCYANRCAQCDPTTYAPTCKDGKAVTCDANGMLVEESCTGDKKCRDGYCTNACASDGDCAEHYKCVSKICEFQPECTVDGKRSCSPDGGAIRQCEAGLWKDAACPAGDKCDNGKCIGQECTGNSLAYCIDKQPAICDNGHIVKAPSLDECTGDLGVCLDGSCVACDGKTQKPFCYGNVWKQCSGTNYINTTCADNQNCDDAKGCVSKCGESFAESCANGKHTYCDNTGKIQTENCEFNEVCKDNICQKDEGTACDANVRENQCIEQKVGDTTNVWLKYCDPGKLGISYRPCMGENVFCGTLQSATGCFTTCDDTKSITCVNGKNIGPCLEGTDYLGNAKKGVRLGDGYCTSSSADAFSHSCARNAETGGVFFNQFNCKLLGATSCDEATGACDFPTCAANEASCDGTVATSCIPDPANGGKFVKTSLDCSKYANATCVKFNANGYLHAACAHSATFENKDGTKSTYTTLGSCNGNYLQTLYWLEEKNNFTIFSAECKNGCETLTDNGVTFSRCK